MNASHLLNMLTCSNQSYANRGVCCFVNSNHRGNQNVKSGMGIAFTAWALQLLHYAGYL